MEERDENFSAEKLTKRMGDIIKRDWNTIPNYFSYFRLVLIPCFIWLYLIGEYAAASVVIVVSWISDIADGFIARRFNMASELGKVLDPVADKLTQGAIFICLSFRYTLALVLVLVIAAKEITMLIIGTVVFKKANRLDSARWYGKLATGAISVTALVLVLVPTISDTVASGMLIACIVFASFSALMYIIRYLKIIFEIKKEEES